MRKFSEPTCKNLLKQPLMLGLPISSLGFLTTATIVLLVLSGWCFPENAKYNSVIVLAFAVLGYLVLRVMNRFLKLGWDESLVFWLERIVLGKKTGFGAISETNLQLVSPPDTLDEEEKVALKIPFERDLSDLDAGQVAIFRCKINGEGASLFKVEATEPARKIRWKADLKDVVKHYTGLEKPYIYSLIDLPASIHPMWLFVQLRKANDVEVITSIAGVDQSSIKGRIETARWFNKSEDNAVDEVDSGVSVEHASKVLKGLSTGEDRVFQISLVIVSKHSLKMLDKRHFIEEKNPALTLLSSLGLRRSFHRTFYVRLVTAEDLIFNIADPKETGISILKTKRGNPLYFDPQDSRLDALHWLVVGGTGTGKSFFVSSVLLRIIEEGQKASVLFIDSKRSFRRIVKAKNSVWIEPTSFDELASHLQGLLEPLEKTGIMVGVELSTLLLEDQEKSATFLLQELTKFLKRRVGEHVIYIVLDECWRLLLSNPTGVQEAFREFRYLDAAAIAITQSLSDFTSNEIGKSVIQNTPIRILLRQDEDIRAFKHVLGLTETEIANVKKLEKVKGEFADVLIKTPFMTRFGALHTNKSEHELLRTDNVRAELVQEHRQSRKLEESASYEK